MEIFFLVCFLFGAIFTAASVLFGFAGSIGAHIPGGHGDVPAIGHGHVDASAMSHALGHGHVNGGTHGHGIDHSAHATDHGEHPSTIPLLSRLPLLNPSALLAFITCFGATGYIFTHFGGWPSLLALVVALVPGLIGDVIIAAVIAKIVSSETVMRPIDYELQGTLGRVTISIPTNGVGEVIFSKGGTRRSEAARSLSATAIPYDTEVVIVDYERGVAVVVPYDEFVRRHEPNAPSFEQQRPA